MNQKIVRSAVATLLMISAAVILYLNEGAMDVAKVARSAVPLSADELKAVGGRRLVAITGALETADQISDGQFLRPGRYIKLIRKTETYVRAKKAWLTESKTYSSPTAKIGLYSVDPAMMEWPRPKRLHLSYGQVMLDKKSRLENDYVYAGGGKPARPQPGDVRVSYFVVAVGQRVTAFGKLEKDLLAPYVSLEYKFYRMFAGTRDDAISTLPAEHKGRLWSFRLIGFLLMWLGFSLLPLRKIIPPAAALVISTLIIVIIIFNIYFWIFLLVLVAVYLIYLKFRNAG